MSVLSCSVFEIWIHILLGTQVSAVLSGVLHLGNWLFYNFFFKLLIHKANSIINRIINNGTELPNIVIYDGHLLKIYSLKNVALSIVLPFLSNFMSENELIVFLNKTLLLKERKKNIMQ